MDTKNSNQQDPPAHGAGGSMHPRPSDIPVQCVRCRNRHNESERRAVPGQGISALVCPRCACRSFYDMRPQVAWCWASGLVETGDESEVPAGSIVIAHGSKANLVAVVGALCRHGKGESAGKLLVPGVPEADDQKAAGDALAKWLAWCAKNNGHKGRYDVTFVTETIEATT